MKVAIIGSRDWPDAAAIGRYVDGLPADTVVLSGGASGADTMAYRAARRRGLEVEVFLPDYEAHGDAAPLIRNRLIARNCERLVAFWRGGSRGTNHTVKMAQALGKDVEIFEEGNTP